MRKVKVTSSTLPGARRCGLKRLTHHRARVAKPSAGSCTTGPRRPGFTSRSQRDLVAGLLDTSYTASQLTYELRRSASTGAHKI